MPIDIAKTYLEVQQLRKEVRRAELDIIISLGRPPDRSLHNRGMNAGGLQTTNSQMPLVKRNQN
ncbi:hypothetical protein V1292_006680 [Bradyrhizobium sp. AZCC 1719]|uniref:hypothetical protein n=1 Tax=Bradyrhizobium sp. AZCC 1719 TaxID=3117028 RepID=UPI002FEF975C